MPIIIDAITLQQVEDDNPQTIYYGFNTCWWTHRATHLYRREPSGLPCDPRGGMLMMMDAGDFIDNAKRNPDHYGRHGLDALMAAHHLNCIVSETDVRNTCMRTWDEYNAELDRRSNG